MKKIYLIIALVPLSACRKNPPATSETLTRFNCVCETKITYADHCGRDSSLSASPIYSAHKSEAVKECSANNASASNSFSASVKVCELK